MLSLFIGLLIFLSQSCCDDNSWRGIRPLETTREGVEKIVGKPMPHSVNPYAAGYETKDGQVSIRYSRGNCRSPKNSGWDIPELTVIDILLYPKEKLLFGDLKIDLKEYEKVPDPEIISYDEYTNYRDGLAIVVDRDEGAVVSIRYFPKEKDRKARICK